MLGGRNRWDAFKPNVYLKGGKREKNPHQLKNFMDPLYY